MSVSSPLFPLLSEINHASKNGLPFLAISMAVSLPDICVSLISEDGRTSPKKYKKWCEENLKEEYFGFITPEDMYSMRCGILHNGRFGDLKHSVSRVIFILPGSSSFVNCKINDAFLYSVDQFCRKITDAVYQWVDKNSDNKFLLANSERLMQYRKGLFPYIGGSTVIA